MLTLVGFSIGRNSNTQAPRVVAKNEIVKPTSASRSAVLGEIKTDKIATQTSSLAWATVAVTKVIDGDTIDVLIDGKKETVRLIGINTPESVDPRRPVQCFGKEASDKARKILNNKDVYLESDSSQGERDKYSRLLRYVFLEDGTNFNKLMIQEGYAYEYTYNTPYKYQQEFRKAQKEAEDQKIGLWADDACKGSLTATNTPSIGQRGSVSENSTYSCDCSKACSAIETCEEATYQLKTCGCTARDADGDGVPCESLCR